MLATFIALWIDAHVLASVAAAPPASRPAGAPTVAAAATPFFNLDFAGGTLRAYVAALQKETPLNLVIDDGTGDLPMPPVSLRFIDAVTALSLIERVERGPSGDTVVRVDQVKSGAPDATPTYRVRITGPAPRTANDVVIESIADVISAGMKADAVLSAIEAGTSVALGDRAKAMELNFHEPTSLLMARGPAEGCNAARQVVESLRAAVRPSKSALEAQLEGQLAAVRRDAERELAMARNEMEHQLMEARMKVAELHAALEATKQTAELERARFEKLAQDAMARFNEASTELARLRMSGGKPG